MELVTGGDGCEVDASVLEADVKVIVDEAPMTVTLLAPQMLGFGVADPMPFFK